ncbi:uncharacterized protein GBIM_13621 [Gryllus bimaculatus]|nr:uncharacterized protein GBIM_13621 [Gryllus bimaculatus]
MNSAKRYYTNPTVVALEKNYMEWIVQMKIGLPAPQAVLGQEITITPILGEFGFCYTYASPIAHYISPKPLRDNPKMRDKYKANVVNCQKTGDSCSSYTEFPKQMMVKFSVHSPYEMQQASDKFENGQPGINIRFYTPFQIVSDVEVYELKPSQRHCFLQTEPSGDLPFSSFNVCLMNCRRRLAIRLCGCAPFFYNSIVSYGGTVGFFLGCSLLSVFELVYFFTLRLVCVVFCHSRGSKGADRQKRRKQWFQSLHPNLKEPFY